MYNICIEFIISMKLIKLIKMRRNETLSRVQEGKRVSDMFHVMNGLKQGDAIAPLLFNFTLEYEKKHRSF